jgi:hypothetical protein
MMLDSFFLPQLRRRRCSLHAQWFQQYAARPHTTPEVLQFLHSKFQHRIVSTRFPQQFQCGFSWPQCSPDLNPCDYFHWGYLKDRVFSSAPRTLPELKETKVLYRSQEECSAVLYRNFYYVFKRFESPKGLTTSMSSTTLPICEILIFVSYFCTVFI